MTILGRLLRTLSDVTIDPDRRDRAFHFLAIPEAGFLSGAIALGPGSLTGARVRDGRARF